MTTLHEFCDLISAELVIRRYPNQGNRWSVCFDGCEVKDDWMLVSMYGNGFTIREAISDYISKIKSRTLVFDATLDCRREYVMSTDVEF